MTTVDQPLSATVMMRVAAALSARARKASVPKEKVTTFAQAFVKLVMHIAGFTCLTVAGFTWNITAGLIIAGVSCFAFSWLSAPDKPNGGR
jgi:hypothetical protein